LQVAVQSPAGSSLVTGLLEVLKRKTGKALLASELTTEIVQIVPEISSSLLRGASARFYGERFGFSDCVAVGSATVDE
jgi:hypothetical protein